MNEFLLKAFQLILSLSLLIVIHECGHFFASRLFKVRVEKFYLFFNPWFSLFKFKPKNSETEYGLGWLPLGGYVKIAGMIDESMDKDQLAQPEQPWEFRSKPAWQRLIIMVAGVFMNFILALFIYSMILFTWGDKYVPLNEYKMGMEFSKTALNAGFQNGDILLKTDKGVLNRFNDVSTMEIAESKTVVVLRKGKEITIQMPADFVKRLLNDKQGFASPRIPMVVKREIPGKPAALAGITAGDSIIAINNIATPTAFDVMDALFKNAGKPIAISFYRNNQLQTRAVTPDVAGKIGVELKNYIEVFNARTNTYSIAESIPAGVQKGLDKLSSYTNNMKYVFTKEGATSLGGFGTLGSIFPSEWYWPAFWEITAFLSIVLAFMNILPIPALDGGHVLFLLYEVIARRKPNEKFMEYAQMAGMILLFGLLIFANGNDILRFFIK